jgi:predicted PurR-regulated permease PerM
VIHRKHLISPEQALVRVSLLVAFLFLLIWVVSWFPDLMLAFIIAGLSAFVVSPVVSFLEIKIGLRRIPAITITFILIVAVQVATLIKGVPYLLLRLGQIQDRFRNFPFDEKLTEATKGIETALPFIDSAAIARTIHSVIAKFADSASSSLQNSVWTIMTLAIVPFITYFILADGKRAYLSLVERVPNRYFEMTLNVIDKIKRLLVNYLKGWILDSMIVGFLSMAGLFILGVNNAIVIGIVAGIANLVPYLGPIVAATLAILVSLTQFGNFSMVGPILILTLFIRLTDDFVVQPLCFAKTIDMHPLTVLLLLIVGHEILGVGGMLLAIPLGTIIKVSAVETYWGLKHYRITAREHSDR